MDKNPGKDVRDRLIRSLATLGAHREELRHGRTAVTDRAREQLDSMPAALHVVRSHVENDAAGGILGQRRLRTLNVEHSRLSRVIAEEEARKSGRDADADD